MPVHGDVEVSESYDPRHDVQPPEQRQRKHLRTGCKTINARACRERIRVQAAQADKALQCAMKVARGHISTCRADFREKDPRSIQRRRCSRKRYAIDTMIWYVVTTLGYVKRYTEKTALLKSVIMIDTAP